MRKLLLSLALSFGVMVSAIADEGMWLPSLIHKMNIKDMQEMGCELSAEDIYSVNNSSLKDAIVALDRGSCTAELVSSKGLLFTNHHCGFGEIQKHSTVEHDYLKDGFWAQSLSEELPNPGKTVTFLKKIEDVTERVLAEVNNEMSFEERNSAIANISREISEEAKEDDKYEATVKSFFESNKFYLLVSETFKDVRLVGCPPKSIGKFGGDTDNWMWPRHTGDFCIFRVYTGPDGEPASYSEDNIPLEPKHYLPISIKGVELNDYAMVFGYPGRTNRYLTSTGVQRTIEVTNNVREEVRAVKLGIIKDYMKTSPNATIQYASKAARSSNYYKYSIGQNNGLANLKVIDKKIAIEEEFTNWAKQNAERKAKYGKALDLIREGYADLSDDYAQSYMAESMIGGPEIFTYVNRMRIIDELLNDPEKNKRRIERMVAGFKGMLDGYFKDYSAKTDEMLVAALMELYSKNVDEKFHPAVLNTINTKYKGNFQRYASKMFDKSIFDEKEKVIAFLDNPSKKVLKKDMAYQTALSIFEKFRELGSMVSSTDPIVAEGERLFVAGLMEMNKDKFMYPDANSTLRLTYGRVMDYDPKDGVNYKYFTTLKGYAEKEIPGDIEFDVPPKLLELYEAKDYGRYADKDGTLHTCFISNNDITGGNSGSPVINGKGELIGLAFDGNWEAMSGDIAFEPELQRCINVDVRFVLWIIDKYAGATHLIDEMTIVE